MTKNSHSEWINYRGQTTIVEQRTRWWNKGQTIGLRPPRAGAAARRERCDAGCGGDAQRRRTNDVEQREHTRLCLQRREWTCERHSGHPKPG